MTVPAKSVEGSLAMRILLVDDDRTLREGAARVMELDGHSVTQVARSEEALSIARQRRFELMIVDLQLGPLSGLDLMTQVLALHPGTFVVVTTGDPSVESNMEALQAGAWDYLPKPFSASHLQVLVGRAAHAIAQHRATQAAAVSRPRLLTPTSVDTVAGMALLGHSPAFRRAVELAEKVASTDASVMISGESGTGKELIAQHIHSRSRRAGRLLVPVNCAALPDNLLESEMFGYRKGAFTGADRDKAGLLEMAHGATLFLDELTEMPMPLQAKLLRVLQDGVVRRLGSETQDAVVDVRFISATNRDPQEAVREGVLREDLFYRLRVVPIKLPPLRSRPDDIALLAVHFLRQSWERHRRNGSAPTFAPETIADLQSRPWRGNVRELQNLVEHVAVISDAGAVVRPDDLPTDHDEIMPGPRAGTGDFGALFDQPFHAAKDQLVAQFEQEYVRRITARTHGNMSKAARLAGIDRTTLYRLLEKHGGGRTDTDPL